MPRRRRQPGLEQLAVGHLGRNQHLARNVPAVGVELLQRRGEDGLRLGEAVEEEALPGHHLPVADGERLDRRPVPLHVGGEEVALLQLGGRDLLRRLQPLQGPDLVAQGGRLLEALLDRHALHVGAQATHHLLGAPLQEETGVVAGLPVALERADLLDAGGDAALDLVLEAGPGAAAVQRLLAGADAEQLPDEPGRLPSQAGRDVGPAIGVPVLRGPAHDVEARVVLLEGQPEVGMILVVAEADVVQRLVALDEVVLESQRLHLGVGDHELEIGDVLDHPGLVELRRAGSLEVRPHPVAQHPGLADVDDRAVYALEQVDPGPVWKLLELVGQGHGLIMSRGPSDRPEAPPSALRAAPLAVGSPLAPEHSQAPNRSRRVGPEGAGTWLIRSMVRGAR